VIRFTKESAARAKETRWHPSQSIEEQPDGSLIWRARISGLLEIRAWVLTWGDGAEVLRPEALREDMARTHQAAAARYGTSAKPNA